MRTIQRLAAAVTVLLVTASCSSSSKRADEFNSRIVTAPYGAFQEGLLGKVKPQGWIEEFLQRQNSGMTGHPESMSYPYNSSLWAGDLSRNTSEYGSDWWRYEQTAYYSDGLLRLGYLLSDSTLIRIGEKGIEYTLSNVSSDGRLGVHTPQDNNNTSSVSGETQNEESVMTWPMSVYFRVMQAYYQVTGDRRIPEALEENFLTYTPYQLSSWRNFISIEGILWTYALTGNEELLDLAKRTWDIGNFEVNEELCLNDKSVDVHGVTVCESMKIPMLLYAFTGEQKYLDAAINIDDKVERDNMLPDGVPSSAENLVGQDVTRSHETCDISDFTWTMGYYLMTTGQAKWADRIETAVFNAGLGAVTKDFKALQYFSSVNQFIATGESNNNDFKKGSTWMAYRPTHETECCAGNVHRFMPNYVARMYLVKGKDALVSALYGPSEVTIPLTDGSDCGVLQKTAYPFEDEVNFEFNFTRYARKTSGKHHVSFYFRIPSWVEGAQAYLNGKPVKYTIDESGFALIDRDFRNSDVVTVKFDVPVEVKEAPLSQGYYVQRGPVLYSYAIPTNMVEDTCVYDNMHGKAPENEEFKCWSMTPSGQWNFGMEDDATAEFFKTDSDGYPFDPGSVPSKVIVPAREIDWSLDQGRFTPKNPRYAVEPITDRTRYLELVPYGSTCLRLTVFPRVR